MAEVWVASLEQGAYSDKWFMVVGVYAQPALAAAEARRRLREGLDHARQSASLAEESPWIRERRNREVAEYECALSRDWEVTLLTETSVQIDVDAAEWSMTIERFLLAECSSP